MPKETKIVRMLREQEERLRKELREQVRSEIGRLGAEARNRKLTPKQRQEQARKAAQTRWRKHEEQYKGWKAGD